jgi:ribonuclease BN (tRNA processing enzyme)
MSLQTCIKTLKANDLSQVNNIVLIHLSDRNSDESRFKSDVERATGKVVHVADKGMIVELHHGLF